MKNKSVAGIITEFLLNNLRLSIALLATIIAVVLVSLAPPQILRYIVDNYLSKGINTELLKLAIAYFGVLIIIGAFDFIKESLLTICGQKISRKLTSTMLDKKNRLRVEYFTVNSTGSIVSILTNDVSAIMSLFTNGIVSMIIDVFKIIGIVVSICFFSKGLGLIIILVIPVIFFITRLFQKKMLIAQLQNRRLIARVNNHIPESIKNIEMIKSFCKEEYMERRYNQYINDSYQAIERVNFYDSIFSPIILIIRALVIEIMVILCSDEISLLGISVGMVAAAIELISNIFAPIESLGMEIQSVQQAVAGVKRVNEFLNEDEIPSNTVKYNNTDISNSLAFENVSFSYKNGAEVLHNISFNIKQNENITIAGRTGAGKSTIFKLIMGLLEPNAGHVYIGGINAIDIQNNDKRKIFGYVEQSFHFINGSISEQISLRDDSIRQIDIKNVMKFVGLDEYVTRLPNGYATIADKTMFSQGQCQLLSIARAIVSKPPILLLDEITANLDSETEKKIISVLQEAGQNRTLISISHRLSSLLSSDRIIKIENGAIKN